VGVRGPAFQPRSILSRTAGWRSIMLIAKTEEALGARFRPRAQWFGNRAIYNKAHSFDTSGAADVWLPDLRTGIPDNARGNTGYTLVGYGANEVSTMTGTVAAGSKILCLGDPQYFLIVDRIGLDVEAIPHRFGPNMRPLGQRGFGRCGGTRRQSSVPMLSGCSWFRRRSWRG
jgi:HK97 family phage major capsid protein